MNVEFKLPELGENIDSGDVVNVLVGEGQTIEGNQGVVELETDKAVVEIPCPHAGKVGKIHVNKGDTVKVGQLLLSIEMEEESSAEEVAPKAVSQGISEGDSPIFATRKLGQSPRCAPIPAGPAARRMARELDVDLARVHGSGSGNRITPDDVRAAAGGTSATEKAEPVAGEPGKDAWGPIRTEPMSRIRRTIAQRMAHSAATIPHVTNFDDADVTDLENLRKGVPKGFLGDEVKLTAMPFAVKAAAGELARHPMLNSSLDEDGQKIVHKQYVNMGVAVDTPRGLVVPVIRNVDRMTVVEIARALAEVARRARSAEFSVEDLRGGSFTISNLGAVGGTYSTPIINHPEAALLLLGRSRPMPMARDGHIKPRLMMPLSLSYDHRLIDGATAARFLNDVIDQLQSPARLLLEG